MAGNTPIDDVPDAPTIGTATAGTESATVTFTAAATGGAATTFTATSTPGSVTGTSATSPITVSGLTAGTAYTFKVKGTNSTATGPESAASNSATPPLPTINYVGTRVTTNANSGDYYAFYVNSTFVYIVGYNSAGSTATKYALYSSTDGATWTLKTSNLSFRPVYSSSGGKLIYTASGYYVAGGLGSDGSGTGSVWYSTDLITWTAKATGSSYTIRDIETNGSVILALDTNNETWGTPSTDPSATWSSKLSLSPAQSWTVDYAGGYWYYGFNAGLARSTSTTSQPTTVLNSATYPPNRGVAFNSVASPTNFAVCSQGNNIMWTSTDGSTWTQRTLNSSFTPNGHGWWDSVSSNFMFAENNTASVLYGSGASWSSVGVNSDHNSNIIAVGGGKAVIPGAASLVYAGSSLTSSGSWVALNNQYGNPYGTTRGIAYGNSLWVTAIPAYRNPISGFTTSYKNGVSYSSDLSSWTFASTTAASGSTTATNLGLSFANGKFWTLCNANLLSSSNATSWSAATGTFSTGNGPGMVAGDGANTNLVAVSSGTPTYWYSTNNGSSWTTATTTTYPLYQVAYGAGKFVAVGLNQNDATGVIATSTTGATWAYQTNMVWAAKYALSVSYNSTAGLFLIYPVNYSANAYYFTSPNGTTWTQRSWPAGTSMGYQSVYGDSNGFLAFSTSNYQYYQSTDGINWTNISSTGVTGATGGISGEQVVMAAGTQPTTANNGTKLVILGNIGYSGLVQYP